MARLILKSPYIKNTGKAGGYLKYITTRENVQLMEPSDAQQSDIYLKYIGTRPGAERHGAHGLFGDEDDVSLQDAIKELETYTGNVWTHVISLRREDAARLGYDNAKAWRSLLRTHRNEIASAMNIPPENFRWYGAFHNEGNHPHVHMMAWSVQPGQAHLDQSGIKKIKSKLTNDIFRMEMLHTYEQKSDARDELVRQSRKELVKMANHMMKGIVYNPEAEACMSELVFQLGSVTGKKVYGYLPKKVKAKVDEIVDQFERLKDVQVCYEKWWALQCQVNEFYSAEKKKRPRLSEMKEFQSLKNVVIKEAERIRRGVLTFEEENFDQKDGAYTSQTVYDLCRKIYDRTYSLEVRDDSVEQLRQLARKGEDDAQYCMGRLYQEGPVVIPDQTEALYWYMKAAAQENPAAQYALGKLMLSDDMEVRSPTQGLLWIERSARNGNPYAAYRLGKEYLSGRNTEKRPTDAVAWLTTSAEAGVREAQYLLGKLYLSGDEVEQDREAAIMWLTRAKEQKHAYAEFLLECQNRPLIPAVALSMTRLLHHLGRIFRDSTPQDPGSGGMHIDKKRMRKLQEKKAAMGHKRDDHEEYQGPTLSM